MHTKYTDLQDTYQQKGLRQKLLTELRSKGIHDFDILRAFNAIPRHYFLDKAFSEWAYKDIAFPIGEDQTISQPYTVAVQTRLLNVQPLDKILEVGTGSGYQACILAFLGAKVYTVERQKALFEKTEKLLKKIGFGKIRTLFGDGYGGSPRFAPFDKIIVTCGAKIIPGTLLDQLKPGGILVIPVGAGDHKVMTKIVKNEDGTYTTSKHGNFSFVPFLPGVSTSKKS